MSDAQSVREVTIRTELLRAQVVRLQWTVQMGLVLASLLVPEGGRLATLVGVILIMVVFVLLVVLSTMLHGPDPPRRATLFVSLVAAALLIGIGLVWLGQSWLPDRDSLAYTPAWGLFVVAATAVWAIQTARGPVGSNE